MNLAVIVPSRGRPHNVWELIEAFNKTKMLQQTTLIIGVDEDDPEISIYRDNEMIAPSWVQFRYGPRLRLGGTLNKLAVEYAKDFDLIGFMGDDHRPRSQDWDKEFINNVTHGTMVMYGNDLLQGENLPTAVFMTSDIIKILGYMVPQTMVHLFLDNFWKTLGERLGRLRYDPLIIIEHVHPAAGKAAWDERYVEVNSGEQWNADEAAWEAYQSSGELAKAVDAIKSTW